MTLTGKKLRFEGYSPKRRRIIEEHLERVRKHNESIQKQLIEPEKPKCECGSEDICWYNGGNLGNNFNACVKCAKKWFEEKGYFKGVIYNEEDNSFEFFSHTTGREKVYLDKIKKGDVFYGVFSNPLFPYSFNFEELEQPENRSETHCYGCDEETKEFLLKHGWKWQGAFEEVE